MRYELAQPWESAIKSWLDWEIVAGMARETLRLRRGHVRLTARVLGLDHPTDVTTEHLVALYAEMDWSLDHRRGVRTSLNKFYRHCVATGITSSNPAEGLPHCPGSPPRPTPTPEWIWEEVRQSEIPRNRLMVRMAGEAGMRRAEVATGRKDNVIWNGDGYAFNVVGKGGKQRTVPISDDLARMIMRGSRDWSPIDNGYLFPSVDRWGNLIAPHLSPDRVGRIISEMMPQGWTMHKLRHRYATVGFAATNDILAVQEVLGHASVATTIRYVACARRGLRAISDAAARKPIPSIGHLASAE